MRYTKSHEWVRVEGDEAVVGITTHAQEQLGDLVFVEAPVGATLRAGQQAAVVESVKAASEVYTPVSGEVIAFNVRLADEPGLVNTDPEGEGWIFRLRLSAPDEVDALMDKAAYEATLA